jgi:hypothetical protein
MCTRTAAPSGKLRSWTRSQSRLTIHSPRPQLAQLGQRSRAEAELGRPPGLVEVVAT